MQTLEIIALVYLHTFIHELGHTIAAYILGIGIQEVSIGVGPCVLQLPLPIKSSTNPDPHFQIRILPIAGYTYLEGAENPGYRYARHSDYWPRPKNQKMMVLLAGVLLNCIACVLAASFGFWLYAKISAVLALIQLIPFKGTDGWRLGQL